MDKNADTKAGYHRFVNEDDEEYGSFEVYWHDDNLDDPARPSVEEAADNSGWYWQACFPGCMPDGDPNGPYETSDLAFANARDV
jgi:hypothetical protein